MSEPSSPLISVVMPFFNSERTLLDAVRSVFAQTWPHWELLLLDDGSCDGSLALAQSIADPRVRVVSDGANRGHANRRNQLTQLARGQYIALLDSDDLMDSRRLEKQLALLRQQPDVDVVASGIASITHDFRVAGVRDLAPLDMSPASVLKQGGVAHPSIMARRDWFLRHPYREGFRYAEDRDLFLRSLADSRFARLPEPLYFYMESGVISAPKLTGSYRVERELILQYGPALVGRLQSLKLWLRSLAKSAVVRLLAASGRLEVLSRRRLASAEGAPPLASLQAEIERIRATALPLRT